MKALLNLLLAVLAVVACVRLADTQGKCSPVAFSCTGVKAAGARTSADGLRRCLSTDVAKLLVRCLRLVTHYTVKLFLQSQCCLQNVAGRDVQGAAFQALCVEAWSVKMLACHRRAGTVVASSSDLAEALQNSQINLIIIDPTGVSVFHLLAVSVCASAAGCLTSMCAGRLAAASMCWMQCIGGSRCCWSTAMSLFAQVCHTFSWYASWSIRCTTCWPATCTPSMAVAYRASASNKATSYLFARS